MVALVDLDAERKDSVDDVRKEGLVDPCVEKFSDVYDEDDTVASETQIVMDSESDGEYLIYTAKRLQVCVSRGGDITQRKSGRTDLQLNSALLGNPSTVWTPEADFSITDVCASPNSIRPISPTEEDYFSDCSVCNGTGKRPSRRKKQKSKKMYCRWCRERPQNEEIEITGGRVREITSISNDTNLGQPHCNLPKEPQNPSCQPDNHPLKEPQYAASQPYNHPPNYSQNPICQPKNPPSKEPQKESAQQNGPLCISGNLIHPENSYRVYVADLLMDITVKGSSLRPSDNPSNLSTFIVVIEGNEHQGTKLRPVADSESSQEPVKVPGKDKTADKPPKIYKKKPRKEAAPLPEEKKVSQPCMTSSTDQPEPNQHVEEPEKISKPHFSPVFNKICPAPKVTSCETCSCNLIFGGCYNCASIFNAIRDPPPTAYQGVDILPDNEYLVQIPDLATILQISGANLRSNPNDTDLGNPCTILVLTEDKVFIGTTLTKLPVICLGIPINPNEFYDVFAPEFGTTVRVPGSDLSPGADGSTVFVNFKGSVISGTSIAPRVSSETAKRAYKKGNLLGPPKKSFPNKVSELLFGNLGLPLLSSTSSLEIENGQMPFPRGFGPIESDPSTMELDHLPNCQENSPSTNKCPPPPDQSLPLRPSSPVHPLSPSPPHPIADETNPLIHCPDCCCSRDNQSYPVEPPVNANKTILPDVFPKKFIASGHLHSKQCMASVPTVQPLDVTKGTAESEIPLDDFRSLSPAPVLKKPVKKPGISFGGEDGGFSISTMYGPVTVDPGPEIGQDTRKPRPRKRTSTQPPCRSSLDNAEDSNSKPVKSNTGNPGNSNPGNGNPGNSNPGNNNPGNGIPGNSNPGNSNPGNSNPGNGNPGNGNPGNSNPGNSNPGNSNPRNPEEPGERDASGLPIVAPGREVKKREPKSN